MDAVIFDFDGVIVDTEHLHHQAFQVVFEPLGMPITWERYVESYIGFDDRDAVRERHREAGRDLTDETMQDMIRRKARAFLDLVEQADLQPFPGVGELIRELSGRVPLALCSGALSSDVEPILKRFALDGCFDTRVTADHVSVSKPHPESYRTALARLQELYPDRTLSPDRTVAIEDTPTGIESAAGAGLRVLAVGNSYSPDALTAAEIVVETLHGIDGAALDRLFRFE